MKAFLKNYRQSPRKVRLVADAIRGKEVNRARTMLSFMEQKSAPDLKKLIESALANAREAGVSDTGNLVVKEIRVDEGLVMKRWMPMARGRATPIRKKTSRITLVLGEGEVKAKRASRKTIPAGEEKKEKKAPAKKAPAKEKAAAAAK